MKDAPLLWFLRITRFMREHQYTPMKHDSCMFYKLNASGVIDVLLSLHVDDTLASGSDYELQKLHSDLEKQFGTIKASEDNFTHFGVQVWRDKETGNVHSSQKAYQAGLEPVPVPKGKEDTKCDPVQVTAFRSLVSAIAWGGVTNPAAQAGASLYQACLPLPTFADCRHLH